MFEQLYNEFQMLQNNIKQCEKLIKRLKSDKILAKKRLQAYLDEVYYDFAISELQYKALVAYYIRGETLEMISKHEMVSRQAVHTRVKEGLKKLENL